MDQSSLPDFWTSAGFVLALAAGAVTVIAVPKVGRIEFAAARICFVLASFIFEGKLVAPGMGQTEISPIRLIAVGAGGAMIALCLYLCLHWVSQKERALAQTETSVPASAVPHINTEINKNKNLRDKVKNFTSALRRFEADFQANDRIMSADAWQNMLSMPTEEKKNDEFRRMRTDGEKRGIEHQSIFMQNYRPDAISIYEELLSRLKIYGIVPPFRDNPSHHPLPTILMDSSGYLGAAPVTDLADYLDFVARKLPDND